MPVYTPLLNLLKKVAGIDPPTDTFNIQTMMNDNWDKIDQAMGLRNGNADVRAATTGNIALSGLQTVDGIVLAAGDRVLVRSQTTGSQNGIYAAASGAWTRTADADATAKLAAGLSVYVEEGTVNGRTAWRMSNTGAVVLGTTALTFEMTGAPLSSSAAAGAAIRRDSAGRAQVAAPLAAADIARKDTVDAAVTAAAADAAAKAGAVQTNLTAHIGSGGTAHAGAVASGAAGFMSGADKAKLDGVAAGAGTAGSATDTVIGNRTINDAIAVGATDTDTPTNLFSKLAAMLRAITGKADWYAAPAVTLEAAKTHIDATAVGTHGSTTTATASRLVHRDASGRAQVGVPAAAADIARKDTVDAAVSTAAADATAKAGVVQGNLTAHIGSGGAAHANAAASGAAGFMSGADKAKLDGVAAGAGMAGSATDTVIGNRTINDAIAAGTTDTDTPTNLFSKIGSRLRAITGKANWYDSPAISLETAAGYLDQSVRTTASPTFASMTAGNVPNQTTADLTYYVRTDGNDNNNGLTNSTGGAFKTIGKAISKVPQLVDHTVSINVLAGTYTEDVVLQGFSGSGTLTLNGDKSGPDSYKVQSVVIQQCTLLVVINGFRATKTTSSGFDILRSSDVRLDTCKVVDAAADNGISVTSSLATISNSTINGRTNAILAIRNSSVFSENNGGTGNATGLYANFATIRKYGNQPNGTSMREDAVNGGIVTSGALNPWSDNSEYNRSFVSGQMTSSDLTVPNNSTYIKVPLGNVTKDNLGEFISASNRVQVKRTGIYHLNGSIVVNSIQAGQRLGVRLFINGIDTSHNLGYINNGSTSDASTPCTGTFWLNAGDYIEIYVSNTGGSSALTLSWSYTYWALTRIA